MSAGWKVRSGDEVHDEAPRRTPPAIVIPALERDPDDRCRADRLPGVLVEAGAR